MCGRVKRRGRKRAGGKGREDGKGSIGERKREKKEEKGNIIKGKEKVKEVVKKIEDGQKG